MSIPPRELDSAQGSRQDQSLDYDDGSTIAEQEQFVSCSKHDAPSTLEAQNETSTHSTEFRDGCMAVLGWTLALAVHQRLEEGMTSLE
ncbi:hypothetical protein Daesc_009675 [Daldinia eschscholtzii]|uniref:Uncharacterized protein n=1 Tax=Daldinia eschscholtzii TaxID=292717 RepID=A0AAX6MBL8_9PEZI